jgi:hypothetical protein
MNGQAVIGAIGTVAVGWFIVSTLLIYEALRRRGVAVSFLWLRALAPKYAHEYRAITRRETGRTGPLFHHWVVSINVALAAAIVLGVLALLRR